MVAGEFAVLEPYHHLIVMAVDRFVYTTIQESEKNEVTLKDYKLFNLDWKFSNGKVNFTSSDDRLTFVKDAIATALTYLQENNIPPDAFSLTIESELDDHESGLKYGLGSSAAVVTSIITAILTQFLHKPSRELIFKLAAISHIKTQGNGSGADIAASTYGGLINYTSFQAEWLIDQLKSATSLSQLVEKKWKYLFIEQVELPKDIQVCIGWTGKPASTRSLVSYIKALKTTQPESYKTFLHKSEQAIQLIIHGMNHDDHESFFNGIRDNRIALAEIGKLANVEIETDKLHKLSIEAENYSGAGKLSGAGGGDCGIAFIPKNYSCQDLHNAWRKLGILPLPLNVNPSGARVIKE